MNTSGRLCCGWGERDGVGEGESAHHPDEHVRQTVLRLGREGRGEREGESAHHPDEHVRQTMLWLGREGRGERGRERSPSR